MLSKAHSQLMATRILYKFSLIDVCASRLNSHDIGVDALTPFLLTESERGTHSDDAMTVCFLTSSSDGSAVVAPIAIVEE